jgi:hypothetical protein
MRLLMVVALLAMPAIFIGTLALIAPMRRRAVARIAYAAVVLIQS